MSARGSALLLLVSAGLGGATMALPYGPASGLHTALVLLASGAPALAVAHLASRQRRRLGLLGRQFLLGVGSALVVVLFALGLVAASLFDRGRDALMVAVMLTFAAVFVAYAAWFLTRGVRDDIERVRDGLMAVGEGSLSLDVRTAANDETAQLAAAANRMVEQLAARAAERDESERMRHDLVRAMVEQLTEHADERDAAEARRRDLVVALSHDVRTPLTSLQLLAAALDDDILDAEERAAYPARILTQLTALRTLVDEIFEFSRLEAGDVGWTMEHVEVDLLIRETVDGLLPQATEQGVALEASVADDLPRASAAPEKVQRALVNLIDNALHHTPPGQTVRVTAAHASYELEIEVADGGPGVDEADRARIFDPFFRGGANAARTSSGAGLGLAITRTIIEVHGGRLWLADSPHGARFRFTLPRAPADAGAQHGQAPVC